MAMVLLITIWVRVVSRIAIVLTPLIFVLCNIVSAKELHVRMVKFRVTRNVMMEITGSVMDVIFVWQNLVGNVNRTDSLSALQYAVII